MANQEVLNLVTGVERPIVKIDDVAYEMRNAGEFSIGELHRIQTFGQYFAEAFEGSDGKHLERLQKKIVEVMTAILPDAPQELISNMPALMIMKILRVFMQLSAEAMNEAKAESLNPSESSSPDSSASTEDDS